MKLSRKLAIAVLTVSMSVGLVGLSAPAQADSSWGYRIGNGR